MKQVTLRELDSNPWFARQSRFRNTVLNQMIRDPIHERIKQVNHHVDSFRRIKNMPHPTPFPSPPAPPPPLMDMKLID